MILRRSIQINLVRALCSIRPAPVGVMLKRLLRVRRIVIDTAQGRYWLDPVSNLASAILVNGSYEPNMRRTLAAFLGPGKVFIDIGANEGYFTIQGAKLTEPGGQVVAVEPQDRLIPVLRENVRLNGIKNVAIAHTAISCKQGTTSLHLTPDINTGSTSFYPTTKYPVSKQITETITLTYLLDKYNLFYVDLVKMDIEGAEYEAILGSPEVFENHRIKAIALELHAAVLARKGRSADEIESFLRKTGYRKSSRFCNSVWLGPGTADAADKLGRPGFDV